MDRERYFDDLVAALAKRGVTVVEARLPDGYLGGYSHQLRRIYISRDLAAYERLPTLMHEAEHHWRGDDGHQSDDIEALIDERVADELVSATEYALAEQLCGGHTGAIAAELDLPRWVISAYRRKLWAGRIA